jgi:hypothetical protein
LSNPFVALSHAIAAGIDNLPIPLSDTGEAVRHLRDAVCNAHPSATFRSPTGGYDYGPTLRSTLNHDGNNPLSGIIAAIKALRDKLPWFYHYPRRADDPDLDQRIAFAELIGPKGPLVNGNSLVGFTLMAPETFYPLHTHPAVELYMVVSGSARWIVPEHAQIVPPGGFVLHRSGQPHAMQTFAEPLLAIFDWQGDLESPSDYL